MRIVRAALTGQGKVGVELQQRVLALVDGSLASQLILRSLLTAGMMILSRRLLKENFDVELEMRVEQEQEKIPWGEIAKRQNSS